eukprot:Stramenopile-MAST_4_protein_476
MMMLWMSLLVLASFLVIRVDSKRTFEVCIDRNNRFQLFEQPVHVRFVEVSGDIGIGRVKQSNTRTSPNCLFPSWDERLKRWDAGGFCMEETLTGGACIGDANGDGWMDVFFPRMDAHPYLYLNDQNGRFLDGTNQMGLMAFTDMKGNGCVFVDIDNDGDEDLYVSTVGDEKFYLFVNDENIRYIENAAGWGLENRKLEQKLTAGFSIDVADVNNDGYLDIITTEWLPQLNEFSTSPEDNEIQTNSRLYMNTGVTRKFADITEAAGLLPSLNAPRNVYLTELCSHVTKVQLRMMMEWIREPFHPREMEAITRHRFKRLTHSFMHGKYILGSMNYTKRSKDPRQYSFFEIPIGNELDSKDRFVTIEVFLLNNDKLLSIDLFADYDNNQPMVSQYLKRAKSPSSKVYVTLPLERKKLYSGIKCNADTVEGCKFELTFFTDMIDMETTHSFPNDPCSKHEYRMKNVGPFEVPLNSPWISSEKFLFHAMVQLRASGKSKYSLRNDVRSLVRRGKLMDAGIDIQWTQTSNKIINTLNQIQNQRDKWNGWNEFQTGELFDRGMGGNMMHFHQFPLIGSFQFAAKFTDLDMDGFVDIIMAGDFGTSAMYWNNKNETFVKGHFDVINDILDNSMGASAGDWDLDGLPDVLFTSTSINQQELNDLNSVATTAGMILNFQGNHLYKNLGNRRFVDSTNVAGIKESGWGWGAFMFDFDNDGDLDVLNGNGMDDPETTDDDFAAHQRLKFYVNQGSEEGFAMREEAELRGIASTDENRGAMTFDYDRDGDIDVLLVNHAAPLKLYRNEGGNYNDFVRVRVEEVCGRPSLGAKVFVYATTYDDVPLYQELTNSAAFLGQSEGGVAHFGLGKTNVERIYNITVQWTDSIHQTTSLTLIGIVPIRTEIRIRGRPKGTESIMQDGKQGTLLPECSIPREQQEPPTGELYL